MGIWLTIVGRPDNYYAITSLSRFSSCPCRTHLDMLIRVFGYLRYFPNRQIAIDSTQINMNKLRKVEYCDLNFYLSIEMPKKILVKVIPPLVGVNCKSLFCATQIMLMLGRQDARIIVFIGSTPVLWLSKRQGAIATSTYTAKFMA